MLPRIAARPALCGPLAIRPFSTSSPISRDDRPVRSNPLIGDYVPPKSTRLPASKTPPVSTERPEATQTPSPDKAPASSAEVPPNADMPPPPPPPSFESQANAAPSKSTAPGSKFNLDISQVISNAAERYAIANSQTVNPMKQHRIRTAATTGRTIFLPEGSSFRQLKGFHPVARSPDAAFDQLAKAVVGRYRIKRIAAMQFSHERAGNKRKRMKSERWRKRFMAGFRATTERVRELKRQGW